MASAGQVLGYITLAAKFIFTVIVTLVLAFYWTLDGPRIIQSFLLLVPQDRRENISELISAMETKVGYYIVGQGILCLVIGIMALVAYSADRLAQCLGAGARGRHAGSCTDDRTAAGRCSCGIGGAIAWT